MRKSNLPARIIWIFFNLRLNLRLKPVSTEQAQMFILKLQPEQVAEFAIWTPGWHSWHKLQTYLATEQKYFSFNPITPAAKFKVVPGNVEDEKTPVFTHVNIQHPEPPKGLILGEPDFNAEDIKTEVMPLSVHATSPLEAAERRRHERFSLKLEVILTTTTGYFFRTYSRNISLSGAMLGDPIPQFFLRHSFDLVVINPFEKNPQLNKIVFKSRIVGDFKDARRLIFVEPPTEHLGKLQNLLHQYVRELQGMQAS